MNAADLAKIFLEKDVHVLHDPDGRIRSMLDEESEEIFASESRRKGRTLEQVKRHGRARILEIVAEQYGFRRGSFRREAWDCVSEDGTTVDFKFQSSKSWRIYNWRNLGHLFDNRESIGYAITGDGLWDSDRAYCRFKQIVRPVDMFVKNKVGEWTLNPAFIWKYTNDGPYVMHGRCSGKPDDSAYRDTKNLNAFKEELSDD